MIQCGSYTGDRNNGVEIDLGWEPQWILIKCTSSGGDAFQWLMLDTMRGLTESDSQYLYANVVDAELAAGIPLAVPTATGFKLPAGTGWNTNNETGEEYIYMAIRRPNKPAEEFEADELFAMFRSNNIGSMGGPPGFRSGFPVDMAFWTTPDGGGTAKYIGDRLNQGSHLYTHETDSAYTSGTLPDNFKFDYNNGYYSDGNASYFSWMWRRAPGFFDVVTYEGDGVAGRKVPHGLGVAPEMMWVKCRGDRPWRVYCESLGSRAILTLNANDKVFTTANEWNNKNPTDTVFTLDGSYTVNGPSNDYIAYLWASVPGICDIGTYTGNGGSATEIDCGFTNGARFVLIKRTDEAGDWMYFDTLRGITDNDSPKLALNDTEKSRAGARISPASVGFKTRSSEVSVAGGTYIYMAIA
jgi:hypothetical protein